MKKTITKKQCSFCGASKNRIFYRSSTPPYVFMQCRICRLIWLDGGAPQDNLTNYYGSVYYPNNYTGRTGLRELFSYRFRLIGKHIAPGLRVLEIGAASGDFLSLLRKKEYDSVGVELSQNAVNVAKEKYGIDILRGDLHSVCFEDGCFDGIVSYHVLEHTVNPKEILNEAYRILKKGGKMIIEVPHPTSIDGYFSKKLLCNILDYPNHLYLFPPHLFREMVEGAGFHVIEMETSFSYLLMSFVSRVIGLFRPLKTQENLIDNLERGSFGELSLKDNRKDGFAYHLLRKIFPGMKITIVAQKK